MCGVPNAVFQQPKQSELLLNIRPSIITRNKKLTYLSKSTPHKYRVCPAESVYIYYILYIYIYIMTLWGCAGSV